MIARSLLFVATLAIAMPIAPAAVSANPRPERVVPTRPGDPPILPPTSAPYGKTYDEWSVAWWQWFIALTPTQFSDCTIGVAPSDGRLHRASDTKVAFLLAGPPFCEGAVPTGTSLFFPIVNSECSSLEPDPFFGGDPAARESCAQGYRDFLATLELVAVIDGQLVQNPTSYLAHSPEFSFTVGQENVFGIPCDSSCTGQAAGYGFYLMLPPLSKGTHTIRIQVAGVGLDTTWTLTVN